MAVVTAVLKRRLGVFLQLLGQVGARRGRGDTVPIAVVRDLELLHKAHRPGSKRETGPARLPWGAPGCGEAPEPRASIAILSSRDEAEDLSLRNTKQLAA